MPEKVSGPEDYFQLAMRSRREGDWQASLQHLIQATRLAPEDAKYHANIGATLFLMGRQDEAALSYERAIAITPGDAIALNNLAAIYSAARKYAEAEALLHRSIEINPGQKEAWLNLCSAVENLDYREDDVVVYARQAVGLAPREAQGYRFLGKALLKKGLPEEALRSLNTAAALEPHNADIQYSIGICNVQMDRVPEAVRAFQGALALDPGHGQTYYALGEFLYRLEEYPAAEEATRQAMELLDDKISTGKLLAGILFAMRRREEARSAYIQARSLENALLKRLRGIPNPNSKIVLSAAEGVEQWCRRHGLACRETLPETVWQARPPLIFGNAPAQLPLDPAAVPHAYVAEIMDATIVPGHEVVLVDQERHILYERLIQMGDWQSMREDPLVPLIDDCHVLAECGPLAAGRIDDGIFLMSEGWRNYAHWLIEQLPRLFSIEQFPEYAGMPVLVNEGLFPQQVESLRLICQDRFPIRLLNDKERHAVGRLIYPTNLVAFHRRRFRAGQRATTTDGPFNPQAVRFLRDRLLPQCAPDAKPHRRLWLSRQKQTRTGQRRLTNEAEIEALFLERGFESVRPETLSFAQQIRLFAEAELIAGPGGAAMMNIVFAPPGCRTLILTKNHPEVNFHYFTNIGQIIGHEVAHLCGEHLQTFGVHGFETDFSVPLETVRQALRQFMGV